MSNDSIGATIVLKADDQASSTIKQVADASTRIVQEVTAGDRAFAKFDNSLKGLSVEKLREVEDRLKAVVAGGGAGLDVKGYESQLAHVQEKIARAGEGDHGGAGLDHLKEKFHEVAAEIPGVSGALGGFGSVASAIASGPLAVVGLAVGALTGIFEGAERAIEEFSQTEVANTKLDQALAQSGQLTDEYREKLQHLSGELQETTGIADERWADVLRRLTQFGATPETIEENVEAVKNLAGIMGGDIDRAAASFSRAMNGNFNQLTRLGLTVDKTASQHEKLESVMAQLAQRGGGQLEVQTRTIAGGFTSVSNSTADLFKGFGNLLSRTGILQGGLKLLSGTIQVFSSLLPSTVAEVEGITNKLPPLHDAAGKVKGAVGEMGDEMDEAGQSAEGAAGGVETLGAAAGKAKDQFEEALEALKKLKEQQDGFADASTQLKLAQIDSDFEGHKITKSDADKQRAAARAEAEQGKLDRQRKEQEDILRAQTSREGKTRADAETARSASGVAEGQFGAAAQAAGISPEEAAQIAAAAEDKKQDLFGDIAKNRRAKAAQTRQVAQDLTVAVAGSGSTTAADTSELDAVAESYDRQAEAMTRVKKAYDDQRQAQSIAAELTGKEAEEHKKTGEALKDYTAKTTEIAVRKKTATVTAGTERQKLANRGKKQREDDAHTDREREVKDINTALADKEYGRTPAQKEVLRKRRRELETANDAYTDQRENEKRPVPAARQRDLQQSRDYERNRRDERDTAGGGAVVDDAAKLLPLIPAGTSGSLPGQARALIEQITKGGGKDVGKDDQLLTVLQAIADNLSQNGGANAARDTIVKKLRSDLETVKRSAANGGASGL